MFTVLKNKIGTILAYGAKILNTKILSSIRNIEKVNSKSGFDENSMENQIEEFIENVESDGEYRNLREDLFDIRDDLSPNEYYEYLQAENSHKYAKKAKKVDLYKNWRKVKDLSEAIEKSGKNVYGMVYKFTHIKTGLSRVGQAKNFKNRLRLYLKNAMSLNNFFTGSKDMKMVKDKLRYYPFDIALFEILSLDDPSLTSLNSKELMNEMIKRFFKEFEVEIISCQNKKEYDATEVFWTLYQNRADNEQGYDLSRNEYYNPIIGNLFDQNKADEIKRKSMIISKILEGLTDKNDIVKALNKLESQKATQKNKPFMWSLNKLKNRLSYYFGTSDLNTIQFLFMKPTLEACLREGLSKQETIKELGKLKYQGLEFIYENRLATQLDRICNKFVQKFPSFEAARKYYIIQSSQMILKEDKSNLIGFDNDYAKEIIWITKDADGNTVRLDYGFHFEDTKSGKGLIHSFIKYRNDFKTLSLTTPAQIAEITHQAILENNRRVDEDNNIIYKININGEFEYLVIKIEKTSIDSGYIEEIYPYEWEKGQDLFSSTNFLGEN